MSCKNEGSCEHKESVTVYTLFETTASSLDSASGSVLSPEALSTYTQSTRNFQNNRVAKLALAESGAEAVVSKRAIVFDEVLEECDTCITWTSGSKQTDLPIPSRTT